MRSTILAKKIVLLAMLSFTVALGSVNSLVDIAVQTLAQIIAQSIKGSNIDEMHKFFKQESFPQELSTRIENKIRSRYGWQYALKNQLYCSNEQQLAKPFISDDGTLIATYSMTLPSTIFLWDETNNFQQIQIKTDEQIKELKIAPNGQFIACLSINNQIAAYNLQNKEWARTNLTHENHNQSWHSFAISNDSQLIITWNNNQLLVWQLVENQWQLKTLTHILSFNSTVIVSPDSSYIVAKSSVPGNICLWQRDQKWDLKILQGQIGQITTIAISPDSRYIVTAQDATIYVWDRSSDWKRTTLTGHTSPIATIDIALNSAFLIAYAQDSTFRVWNLNQTTSLIPLTGPTERVHTLAISSDSRYIIAGTGNGADTDDETVDAMHGKIVDSSGELHIWDNQDHWMYKKIIDNIATPLSVRTSGDGSFMICQLSDFSAHLFERSKWSPVPLVNTAKSAAMSIVAIAPNSSFIVTTGNDNTMTLWLKAPPWIPLRPAQATLEQTNDQRISPKNPVINSLMISPKSNYLITQEKSSTYTIQKYSQGDLAYILCSLAMSNSKTESERDMLFKSKLFLSLPLALQKNMNNCLPEKTDKTD